MERVRKRRGSITSSLRRPHPRTAPPVPVRVWMETVVVREVVVAIAVEEQWGTTTKNSMATAVPLPVVAVVIVVVPVVPTLPLAPLRVAAAADRALVPIPITAVAASVVVVVVAVERGVDLPPATPQTLKSGREEKNKGTLMHIGGRSLLHNAIFPLTNEEAEWKGIVRLCHRLPLSTSGRRIFSSGCSMTAV